MSTTNVVAAAANVATAVGLVGVAWQLVLNRRKMTAAFERTFVDRYEKIIQNVPLRILLGGKVDPVKSPDVLRAMFDYFELCEEELYFRKKRKVSDTTWNDWSEGMALHLRKFGFKAAWMHLSEATAGAQESAKLIRNEQFALVRKAFPRIEAANDFDPLHHD